MKSIKPRSEINSFKINTKLTHSIGLWLSIIGQFKVAGLFDCIIPLKIAGIQFNSMKKQIIIWMVFLEIQFRICRLDVRNVRIVSRLVIN